MLILEYLTMPDWPADAVYIRTSMVKGECADGCIMCLEDGYKAERQPVLGP
jgi:hypothetical protein